MKEKTKTLIDTKGIKCLSNEKIKNIKINNYLGTSQINNKITDEYIFLYYKKISMLKVTNSFSISVNSVKTENQITII